MADKFDYFSEFNLTEQYLWDSTVGEIRDPTAEALFHEAYFVKDSEYNPSELRAIREALQDYLEDNYGIDFNDQFDWETWRASYAEQ